jgi:hypothetical protein
MLNDEAEGTLISADLHSSRSASISEDQCSVVMEYAVSLDWRYTLPDGHAPGGGMRMSAWEFTVMLAGVDEITPELANALFEAGCDDGTAGSSCGIATVSFAREAPSLEEAIRSAIADIQRAGCRVECVQIEHEELAAWSTA